LFLQQSVHLKLMVGVFWGFTFLQPSHFKEIEGTGRTNSWTGCNT